MSSGHLQCFETSPLNRCRILKKNSKIFGKSMLSSWQFQRDTNHCNMLGLGPCLLSHVQCYSMTSRGRKGSEGKTIVPEGPASNPMPTTNNVATSTPVTGPVAKPTSPAGSVAIFFFFFFTVYIYSLHLNFLQNLQFTLTVYSLPLVKPC